MNNILPIDAISPFSGGGQGQRYAIRGRCVKKSQPKEFDKKDGSGKGKLASCEIVDETTSIKVTFFNEAVDQLFSMMTEGSVFILSGFTVKNADKRFNRTNCAYELTVDASTGQVIPTKDDNQIPAERFNFTTIVALPNKPKESFCDVLGVVVKTGEVQTFQKKSDGSNLQKNTIVIAEPGASGPSAVEVTMWGDRCGEFNNLHLNDIVSVTGCRIGEFMGGTNLTCSGNSKVIVNPAIKDTDMENYKSFVRTGLAMFEKCKNISARQERAALETKNENANANFHGRKFVKFLTQEENFKRGDGKVDFVDVVAYVSKFQGRVGPKDQQEQNLFSYISCPTDMKKLNMQQDNSGFNTYHCPKCNKNFSYEEACIRYFFQAEITDRIDAKWVTFYDEAGRKFFGVDARELRDKLEHMQEAQITRLLQEHQSNSPYLMRLRIKEDAYTNNEGAQQETVKFNISDMEPLFKRDNTSDPVAANQQQQQQAAGAASQQHLSQGRRSGQSALKGPYQLQGLLDELSTLAKVVDSYAKASSSSAFGDNHNNNNTNYNYSAY